MPFGYPISLELSGRRVVVIGSLPVREGKVEALVAGGATDITVVAKSPAALLDELEQIEGVRVERRTWQPEDLDGAFLCLGWAKDGEGRDAIARAARARGVLVNVVDDIPNCDWAVPSIVRRGEMIIAISSGGASPALTKKLRLRLSAEFGEEWAEVLTILRSVRSETMPALPDFEERAHRWADALDLDEASELVRSGRADEFRALLVRRLIDPAPTATQAATADGDANSTLGTVTLVGAGPGDPDLITVAGAEALKKADAVVYDRLVSPALLELAPASARRFYVGKEPGRPAVPQEEIDQMLVRLAQDGSHVVRLKGGDPFVFGRGGEEALACVQAGVPVRVIPGITSSVAAPAAAGIPVTHRGLSQSFTVVTASAAHGDEVDIARAAKTADTLVILMAAGKLQQTCETLIAAGRPADEPAAIVQWATTPDQRSVVGTLTDLPALAAAVKIGPPATLIVGAVAAVGSRIAASRIDSRS